MRNFSHGAIRRAVALFLATSAAVSFATPASALIQSWNGYLWSRTGNLSIQLGNNLTSAWSSRLGVTASAWSAADYIDFRLVAGGTSSATCGAVYGTVQVCNSNYGANGWLGYTYVWTSGGFIVKATVRLNDYYFSMPKYNTDAWRNATICHEVGHTVGLQHSDTIRTNLNIGSCLDYTNDPSGKLGTNGTKANTSPGANDIYALNYNYKTLNATQLSQTKYLSGAGFGIDGELAETLTAVPEPSSWSLLVLGFAFVGGSVRRRRMEQVVC